MIINPISGGGGGQPTAETDPIWQSEKGNYYTKEQSDSKFVEKPFDPSEGATANTFVYLTFNDGSEPRYDYYSTGKIANNTYANNTALETVYFGNGIVELGKEVFVGCSNLKAIENTDSITKMGSGAFADCVSLTEIVVPKNVTILDTNIYINCSGAVKVDMQNVTELKQGAFAQLRLSSITISKSVEIIGSVAIAYNSRLNEITSYALTAPTIQSGSFDSISRVGTLYYPKGSDYSTWKSNAKLSGWTFVEFEARDIEERVDDLDERVTVLEEKKVPTIINVNVDHGQTAYYAYIEGAEKGDICKSKAHRWTEADGNNLIIRPTRNTTGTSGIRSYNGDTLMYYWELSDVVKGESATLELYDANYSKVNEVQIDGENGYSVGSVGNRWVAGSDVASANNYRGEYLEYYFDGSNWNLVTDDVILIKGGGGGTASALHYETDEIEDGEGNTYREMLDINKEVGIHFHLSNDEAGTPSTHIGNGSVTAQQGNTEMTMGINDGYMGAITKNEDGEPTKGVILQPDATFSLFVDDVTTNKSFVYLMNEDGININGNPQPIMQVLTQAEYDALTEKDDNFLYIIKG